MSLPHFDTTRRCLLFCQTCHQPHIIYAQSLCESINFKLVKTSRPWLPKFYLLAIHHDKLPARPNLLFILCGTVVLVVVLTRCSYTLFLLYAPKYSTVNMLSPGSMNAKTCLRTLCSAFGATEDVVKEINHSLDSLLWCRILDFCADVDVL